jgi:exopolysaccharide biosynthesis polyprenyl glycosylphosphotransferase
MSGQLKVGSSADELITFTHDTISDGAMASEALSPGTVRARLILADTVALFIGIALAFGARRLAGSLPPVIVAQHALLVVVSLPGFALGAVMNRLYLSRANARPIEEASNVVRAMTVGVGFLVLLAFGVQFKSLSRLLVLFVAVFALSAVLIERFLARRVFARLRASGKLSRPVVIVGTDAHSIGIMHSYVRDPSLGYRVVGFVGDDDIGSRAGVSVLGTVDELDRILVEQRAIGVVISQHSVGPDDVNALTRRLTDDGYHVAIASSLADIDITRLRPQVLDGRTMIYVEPTIRHGWRSVAKRAFDLALASSLLVLSAPVWLMAAIAIKIDSRGPVLYRQTRVGRHGQLFTMIKMRTMVVDADERRAQLADQNEADGPLFKIADDPRITRIGRFLRQASIDEIPQLISVLRGEMSMVGPRPALPDEVEHWDDALHDRLRVLPGLTGMWQVSGRSQMGFDEYKRLDLYYVDNWSLAHDVRICARTIGVVLTRRGAF